MEVKIQIPDNCELIKDGDTYVVKEKNQEPPKSWEEFCERYPKKKGEVFIDNMSHIEIYNTDCSRTPSTDRNICTSKEEAEAFLALMQLRQLRKAWVGDWECPKNGNYAVIKWNRSSNKIEYCCGCFTFYSVMSFPTTEIALDFMYYFRDLLEKAKVLL